MKEYARISTRSTALNIQALKSKEEHHGRAIRNMVNRKKHELKMMWNVYVSDSNANEIYIYNIFDLRSFHESVEKLFLEDIDGEEFEEKLRRLVSYYFWGKVEWENTICRYPCYISDDDFKSVEAERKEYFSKYDRYPYNCDIDPVGSKKISVYDQVCLNWNVFLDYVEVHKIRYLLAVNESKNKSRAMTKGKTNGSQLP